jgi:hypothetical protein
MDRLTLRVPPDLIRRFDAAAASRGGRSRVLRRLMEEVAQAPLPEAVQAPPRRSSVKLTLKLSLPDLAALEAEAGAVGLSRTQWTVALIRARLYGRPQLGRSDGVAFLDARRELRRIGVNINQIARALNTAVTDGQVLDLEVAQLAAFQGEIAAWVEAMGGAFRGNMDYWRT